jgi:hypothetical protein
MAKKGIQEKQLLFPKDPSGKFVAHKTRLHIIKCACGFEVLVVPDLKAMDRAIQNHIAEHRQARDSSDTFASLEDFLTEQILIAASKMNLPNVS